jgi:GNAT superfamily N-acetyltransferase
MNLRHLNPRNPGTVETAPAERAPSRPDIVRPDPSEAHHLAGIVADAFFLLRPSVWLVSDPGDRATVMRDYFAIAVEHAFEHGHIDAFADRSAVAVWFHNTKDVPEPADYDRRRRDACGRWTENFVFLDGLLARNHPREPHHHLAFIAVNPYMQNRGRGTALLQHHHDLLDAAEIPSYLEAASERLTRVYEKHGYRKSDPFYLAADGPPFWPMHRDPNPEN